MYKNLAHEMKQRKVSQLMLSNLLDIRPATVSDKINGNSKFYFDEALRVKKVFFDNLDIEYLFKTDECEDELFSPEYYK